MKNDRNTLIWRLFVVAVVIFFVTAGTYFLFATTREPRRLEQALLDRYGPANQYTPAADGRIAPERLRRFVRVRQAVQPNCTDYQRILDGIRGLQSIESDSSLSGREKTSRGIDGVKSMITLTPKLLSFMRARNNSLLAQGMGLGEYMYIYLTAYGKQLAREHAFRYAGMEEAYISPRTREEFVQILRNQLRGLEEAGPDAAPDDLPIKLQTEISALQDGSRVAPWPNGPIGRAGDSIAPFRQQLSDLYCDGIVAIELQQKNRSLGF